MDLHVKKCCDCLDEEENTKLTTQEKIKEYIEDHSDSLGCLLSFIILGGLVLGGWSIYNHSVEKQQQEEAQKIQAQHDIKLLEPLYIQKVLELSNKMTKENASYALQTAKYLVLMETNGNEMSLDLLRKKYLDLYQKAGNNVSFQEILLQEREKALKNQDDTTKGLTPSAVLIQKQQQNLNMPFQFESNLAHIR